MTVLIQWQHIFIQWLTFGLVPDWFGWIILVVFAIAVSALMGTIDNAQERAAQRRKQLEEERKRKKKALEEERTKNPPPPNPIPEIIGGVFKAIASISPETKAAIAKSALKTLRSKTDQVLTYRSTIITWRFRDQRMFSATPKEISKVEDQIQNILRANPSADREFFSRYEDSLGIVITEFHNPQKREPPKPDPPPRRRGLVGSDE